MQKNTTWVSTTDSYETKFRKNMIENGRNERICLQMDGLSDEGHTHHLTR